MQVEATRGRLALRFDRRFAQPEAARLQELIDVFGPLTQLTLDFGDVREFEDAAVVPLARAVSALRSARVVLRGLTLHQARMLRYFGVDPVRALHGLSAREAESHGAGLASA